MEDNLSLKNCCLKFSKVPFWNRHHSVYVNDLPNHISKLHLTMFANDFTVTLTSDTLEELQEAVIVTPEEVSTWSQRSKLISNNKKRIGKFLYSETLTQNITLYNGISISDSVKLFETYINLNYRSVLKLSTFAIN